MTTGRLDCPITGLAWPFAALRLRAPIDTGDGSLTFELVRHLSADVDACQVHVRAVLADARARGYDVAVADGWARLEVVPLRWEHAS